MHKLLKASIAENWPPMRGYRLDEVFLRAEEPCVWLRLRCDPPEEGGREGVVFRLYQISQKGDKYLALIGRWGLSYESSLALDAEAVSGLVRGLRSFIQREDLAKEPAT